jgi:O-antigen/teichoic acid export membrane protein
MTAQNVLMTIMFCWYARWKPLLVLNFRESFQFIHFGVKLMVSNIQWYAYSNADFFVTGKVLGEAMLGYYTMSYRLSLLPTEKISATINQVAFPTFSLLQDDSERLKRYILKITKAISVVTFPLLTGMFILADLFVEVVLTSKWHPAIVPLKILCMIGALKSIDVVLAQGLIAKGLANVMLKYSTVLFVVLPLAFYLGSFRGINGVALAWLAVYPFAFFFLIASVSKYLDISWKEYIRNLAPQSLGCLAMGMTIWMLRNFINETMSVNQTVLLIMLTASGCASYLFYSVIFMKDIFTDFRTLVVASKAS